MLALELEGQRLVAELLELIKDPRVHGDPEFVRTLEMACEKARSRVEDSGKVGVRI
jgi:hypothetical protein